MSLMSWYKGGMKCGIDISIDKTHKTDDMYVYIKGVDGVTTSVPYSIFQNMMYYFAKEHYEMCAQDIGGYPDDN